MKELWKMASLKSKAAVIISSIASIAAVANFWMHDERVQMIIWACIIVIWGINYVIVIEQNNKLMNEFDDVAYRSLQWKACILRIDARITHGSIPEEEKEKLRRYIDEEVRETKKRLDRREEWRKLI